MTSLVLRSPYRRKMKIPIISLVSVLSNVNYAFGYRVGPDGSNDMMRKTVEKALMQSTAEINSLKGGFEDINEVKCPMPPLRNQILGTEMPCTCDYWSRPDIHTLGNTGFGGAVHAAIAPLATKLIDVKAYGGSDVRKLIAHELRTKVERANSRVIDLCCGVGISTRALQSAFEDAEFVVGVDTSPEMISMAGAITRHEVSVDRAIARHLEGLGKTLTSGLASSLTGVNMKRKCEASYRVGNAENTKFPKNSFDLATVMYGFHEIPMDGRDNIISEARRLLRPGGHLAVLDICPTYQPSSHMLAGEPFVIEYQQNIDRQIAMFPGFSSALRRVVVPGHVNLWLLSKDEIASDAF
mmetsp:Transcript_30209/g.62879  ORF Transcript_30209/g.62879 Transcript_30209/m.62879 type:complete len:354 (-) Transcript_30209:246-1307(-)